MDKEYNVWAPWRAKAMGDDQKSISHDGQDSMFSMDSAELELARNESKGMIGRALGAPKQCFFGCLMGVQSAFADGAAWVAHRCKPHGHEHPDFD
jgi:hypothetical protein